MTDACENCPLGVERAVASRGPVPARALFLSGAPRQHEEHAGVAFASPLFPWLEERLAAAGIDPGDVHYATLTGCRPPRQRPLRAAEIDACGPRLDLTIRAVEPRVIVLCGPDAVAALLPGVSLSGEHGTLARRGRRRYYPLRHPYAAPHSERYVDEVMDDLRRLAALLDEDWPVAEEEDDSTESSVTGAPLFASSYPTQPMSRGDGTLPVSAGSGGDVAGVTVAPAASEAEAVVGQPSTAETDRSRAGQGEGRDDALIEASAPGDDAATPVEEEDSLTQLSLF